MDICASVVSAVLATGPATGRSADAYILRMTVLISIVVCDRESIVATKGGRGYWSLHDRMSCDHAEASAGCSSGECSSEREHMEEKDNESACVA